MLVHHRADISQVSNDVRSLQVPRRVRGSQTDYGHSRLRSGFNSGWCVFHDHAFSRRNAQRSGGCEVSFG